MLLSTGCCWWEGRKLFPVGLLYSGNLSCNTRTFLKKNTHLSLEIDFSPLEKLVYIIHLFFCFFLGFFGFFLAGCRGRKIWTFKGIREAGWAIVMLRFSFSPPLPLHSVWRCSFTISTITSALHVCAQNTEKASTAPSRGFFFQTCTKAFTFLEQDPVFPFLMHMTQDNVAARRSGLIPDICFFFPFCSVIAFLRLQVQPPEKANYC